MTSEKRLQRSRPEDVSNFLRVPFGGNGDLTYGRFSQMVVPSHRMGATSSQASRHLPRAGSALERLGFAERARLLGSPSRDSCRLPIAPVLLTLLLGATPAWGETRVRLSYSTAPGLSACPGEATLREAVVGHLGRDPFSAQAAGSIEVHITSGQGQLIATADTRGLDARAQGRRELTGTLSECEELVSSLALAIAIAIDPRALEGPIVREPSPPPEPAPKAPPKPAARPTYTQSATGISAAMGALGTWRDQPGAGGFLGLRYRSRRGELGVEVLTTHDFPRRPSAGTIETTYVMGGLLACLPGQFKLCAAGGLGAIVIAASGYDAARRGSLLQATIGPRLEWEPTASLLLLPRIHLELPLALHNTRLLLGNQVVGELPSFGLHLGLSFFLEIRDGSDSPPQP